jgi:hypothetical protein
MEITVKRTNKANDYTIGQMFIDGEYFCDTLEDTVRDLTNVKDKIYGRTAIPAGTYSVILDYSGHFKKLLPHILDVPFFSGVRIHSGNDVEDTNGCILVGFYYRAGYITESRATMEKLMKKLSDSINKGDRITLTIG